ncbi:methyl-accepting chemotaxis protein [Neptuniibacter halophilus]|uniref:methyl-accepting chemotaxis protein n=1 Tax=Neptuniibacter halophilus TaxID=651666 RepID=UPI002572C92E|nr:methyl-accepting chemotaxis protein [Neptuniibacter halophilus]
MKINEPVTDREVKLRPGQELVSITDLKGIITYANPDFIEISGFSHAELIGKNHNLVRHPDMPPAAFKDLWDTLHLGRPWSKLVKNRCKSGDYYWVKANVTPVFKNGQITEYMSVRTRPSEQEIAAASAAYARLGRGEISLPDPRQLSAKGLCSNLHRTALVGVFAAVLVNLALYVSGVEGAGLILGPLLAFIIMLLGAFRTLQRDVIQPLQVSRAHMLEVVEGAYLEPIPLEQPAETGELNRSIKMLAVKLGFEVNDARQAAQQADRIRVALDNVAANVMLADNQGEIIYCNQAVSEMMSRAEADIREQLPDFSAQQIVGSNFDRFHKNPQHQRDLLQSLSSTYHGRIKVGRRRFDLHASPVLDEQGKRLGTVVEWQDITDQLIAEEQVEELIRQASCGQLNQRLDESLYTGFLQQIASGINQMLGAVVAPLQELKRVLGAMAEGDLRQRMSGDFQGEFAELNDALNRSIDNLNQLLGQIAVAGSTITTGATEISTGNGTLSSRTESQAASLEETAASMEEMTSTVRQNADNAEQARTQAVEAQRLAEKGTQVADSVVASMHGISDSSSRIAEIIGVIDEIAFQTNLLALNAAVEAARAGEQGRGFAVVASEVRSLAQRSAAAAKEIKELISDSVDKVGEGSLLVDQSGQALHEIMSAITRVAEITREIASASREQAIGIEQVNVAVTQMDGATQQNAALVEQVAAASSAMEAEAGQLQSLVGRFKV